MSRTVTSIFNSEDEAKRFVLRVILELTGVAVMRDGATVYVVTGADQEFRLRALARAVVDGEFHS